MSVVQNVNLYLPEFRRKKHWLDARRILLVGALGIGLLALVSGIEYWQLAQLRAERTMKEQQLQQATLATAALIEEFGVQTEDPVLLADIAKLEADLQSKRALLQFLEGRELGNATGFSEHLADLSRFHVQGLALNAISLTDGGRSVRLAGQVVKAELVPIYLQNLSRGGTYSGTDFEMLQISDAPVLATGANADSQLAAWNFQVRSLSK